MKRHFTAVLALFFPAVLVAQESVPELITDRPDQTESAVVIPAGALQIETGAVYEKSTPDDDDPIRSISNTGIATTLIRVGLLKRLELRLIGQYSSERIEPRQGNPSEASGLSDVAIGVKVGIAEEDGLLPDIALNLHTNLVAGAEEFRPEHAFPDFRFLFSHTLTDNLSLGYNLGMSYGEGGSGGTLEYTISLGAGLPADFGAFVELYGERLSGESVDVLFDCGVTYAITPVLQLDVSAGTTLSADIPKQFVSGGISMRFFK